MARIEIKSFCTVIWNSTVTPRRRAQTTVCYTHSFYCNINVYTCFFFFFLLFNEFVKLSVYYERYSWSFSLFRSAVIGNGYFFALEPRVHFELTQTASEPTRNEPLGLKVYTAGTVAKPKFLENDQRRRQISRATSSLYYCVLKLSRTASRRPSAPVYASR